MSRVMMRALYGPDHGARVFDRYMPGWYKRINLDTLAMDNGDSCIAGNLFGDRAREHYCYDGFAWFLARMPEFQPQVVPQYERLGLMPCEDYESFESLEEIWRELIIERLCEDNV